MSTTTEHPEHVTDEELAEVDAQTPPTPARALYLLTRACRELRALRAPVDVEAEVDLAARQARRHMKESGFDPAAWPEVVRPHVERAAVLAREAEGLRAEVATAQHSIKVREQVWAKAAAERDAARAEIERLVAALQQDAGNWADLCDAMGVGIDDEDGPIKRARAMRAEIERLKGENRQIRAIARAFLQGDPNTTHEERTAALWTVVADEFEPPRSPA